MATLTPGGVPLTQPWYHGNITRLQTEERLMRANETGSYLVRDSESYKGAYVLSVLYDGRIYQYRILPTTDLKGYLIKSTDANKQHTFSNVHELIQSYTIANSGLCCALRYPSEVPPQSTEGEEEEEEEQDTDEETPMSDEEPDGSSTSPPHVVPASDTALNVLHSRLKHLSLGTHDSQFQERLREYMGAKVRQDYEDVKAGSTMALHLRQLVLNSAKELSRQVDTFLFKIESLQQLFDLSTIPNAKLNDKATKTGADLKQLFGRLGECQARVTSLENKAVSTFLELSQTSAKLPQSSVLSPVHDQSYNIPDDEVSNYMGGSATTDSMGSMTLPHLTMSPTIFEVKVEGLTVDALKNTKVKLTIDVAHGNLSIMKHHGRDMKEETTPYTHENVVQLIKAGGSNTKLIIRFSNGKKKEYSFEDAKQRETFCQLIQYMKMTHSNSKEVDQISLFIGTWNMGAAMPPSSITSWLTCQGDGKARDKSLAAMPHDIYVIGTQEFKSTAISDKDWIARIKMEIKHLNGLADKEYVTLSMTALWGLRLAVLINPDHRDLVSHVRESSVRTGIANTLGNKGAVGISFVFSGTSFCFVNAHLTSGTEKCGRRNNNYHDILRGLSLSSKAMNPFDLTNQFHHLFFFGDLNYRIEWNVPDILRNISQNKYTILFNHEQLKREKDKGNIFVDFDEREITFPPTYRYKVGDRLTYDFKKVKKTMVRINEPSWCDRVIWRSYPGTHIVNRSYGCSTDICTSDHSPVFATFDVGIAGTTVHRKDSLQPGCKSAKIVFVSAEATLYTSMCGNFYMEFYSSCLEGSFKTGSVKSRTNKTCSQENNLSGVPQIKPSWQAEELPKLCPLISDFSYLEEQHVLVAIKSKDSEESYGEFAVSLKDKISSTPVAFTAILTNHGHRTGEVRGTVHVKSGDDSIYDISRKIKTYEIVLLEEPKERPDTIQLPECPIIEVKQPGKAKGKQKKQARGKVANSFDLTPGGDGEATVHPTTGRPRARANGDTTAGFPSEVSTPSGKEEPETGGLPPPLPPPRRGVSPGTPDVVSMGEPKWPTAAPAATTPIVATQQLKPPSHLLLDTTTAAETSLVMEGGWTNDVRTPVTPATDHSLERPLPMLPPEQDPGLKRRVSAASNSPRTPQQQQQLSLVKRLQSPGKVFKLLAHFEQKNSFDDEVPTPEIGGSLYLPVSEDEEDFLIDGLPPPLPAKSKTPPKSQMMDMEEYETLRRPSTIMEWLMNLGLPQYGHQLLNNGWDNVTYLNTITEKDLLNCWISDGIHRQRMLDSIKSMMQDHK